MILFLSYAFGPLQDQDPPKSSPHGKILPFEHRFHGWGRPIGKFSSDSEVPESDQLQQHLFRLLLSQHIRNAEDAVLHIHIPGEPWGTSWRFCSFVV